MRVYHIKTQKMCLYQNTNTNILLYKCSNSLCAIGYSTNTPLDFNGMLDVELHYISIRTLLFIDIIISSSLLFITIMLILCLVSKNYNVCYLQLICSLRAIYLILIGGNIL